MMERSRIDVVSWDKVYQPKNYGGLGIRKIKLFNKSLLIKIGWPIVVGPKN